MVCIYIVQTDHPLLRLQTGWYVTRNTVLTLAGTLQRMDLAPLCLQSGEHKAHRLQAPPCLQPLRPTMTNTRCQYSGGPVSERVDLYANSLTLPEDTLVMANA